MCLQAWDSGIGLGRSAVARLVQLAVRQRLDDAVVILQSIHHHIEDGLSPVEAALPAQHERARYQGRRSSTRSRAPFRGDVS
jgi:hypothetical protein